MLLLSYRALLCCSPHRSCLEAEGTQLFCPQLPFLPSKCCPAASPASAILGWMIAGSPIQVGLLRAGACQSLGNISDYYRPSIPRLFDLTCANWWPVSSSLLWVSDLWLQLLFFIKICSRAPLFIPEDLPPVNFLHPSAFSLKKLSGFFCSIFLLKACYVTEIISGPWNSGDLPDRQHCCSSNPGVPLAKTLSGCSVSLGTLSYMSVILHDFPWHSLTLLSNCLSMPVGKTQQGLTKPLPPDAPLKRCEDMATASLPCLISESSLLLLPIHWFLPLVFCLNSLTFLSYIVLKIAQVRNLFRPINLSFEKKSITKIDWLNSYSWLPSSTQRTLVAAGMGYNPRTDGSLGLGDLGGILCWALELGEWEPRTWRGMQLRTEVHFHSLC